MTQKTAQVIFIIFNILAIFSVTYAIYDFINITSAVKKQEEIIPFDSGTYYLLLMSVFWVLSLIQYTGLKNKLASLQKFANQALLAWFLTMILLANLIPAYLSDKLETAGYTKCDDPREISRVSKGESSFYIKSGCE